MKGGVGWGDGGDKVDFRSLNQLVAGAKFPCQLSVEWLDEVSLNEEEDEPAVVNTNENSVGVFWSTKQTWKPTNIRRAQ